MTMTSATTTLLDHHRWVTLGTALLVVNQLRQSRNDPSSSQDVFFPRVYAQPTPINEAICSWMSDIMLRTLQQTYSMTTVKIERNMNSSTTPVLIVLTKTNTTTTTTSGYIQHLMEMAIARGWLVAEPDMSTWSACYHSWNRIMYNIQPQVPLYVYVDVGCETYLQTYLDLTGNEPRIHGIVHVSRTLRQRQQLCHDLYYKTVVIPTLILACWEQEYGDDEDHDDNEYYGLYMLAVEECCRNPNVIVVHVVPKVDRRKGNMDHSILPRYLYQTWMAKCSLTFMEATTWFRGEYGKRRDMMVSRL